MAQNERTKQEWSYFELQAYVGTTKHMGGAQTTDALIDLCHIDADKSVLDAGCGAGATASALAQQVGCAVMGVDLRESMVDLARERAVKEGIADHVEFRVADACDLPFEEGQFDVVLSESVLTFVEDKQAALDELARVTRQDGYVGLNEEIWMQPPTAGMAEYARITWGIETEIPGPDGWPAMMERAGLQEIASRQYQLDPRRESTQVARYGCRELYRMLFRTLRLYLRSSAFRAYMKARRMPPKGFFDYLGYGIYVGRK